MEKQIFMALKRHEVSIFFLMMTNLCQNGTISARFQYFGTCFADGLVTYCDY